MCLRCVWYVCCWTGQGPSIRKRNIQARLVGPGRLSNAVSLWFYIVIVVPVARADGGRSIELLAPMCIQLLRCVRSFCWSERIKTADGSCCFVAQELITHGKEIGGSTHNTHTHSRFHRFVINWADACRIGRSPFFHFGADRRRPLIERRRVCWPGPVLRFLRRDLFTRSQRRLDTDRAVCFVSRLGGA